MARIRRLSSAHRFRKSGPEAGEAADRAAEEAAEEIASIAAEMEHWDGTAAAEPSHRRERGRQRLASLAGALARGLGRGGRTAARGAALGARGLSDRLLDAAPRIPVRDLATLRAQHPEAGDAEELADRLTAGAVRASAAVGAGVGAAAMLPTPPTMVLEIAAETLAVAAIEVKLIAELHEAYGMRAPGGATDRAGAYVNAWTNRRGIDVTRPVGMAALRLSGELKQQLRRRLTRHTLRRVPSLTPLLIGAGIGATINSRDTRRVSDEVRHDLRRRTPADPGYWDRALPGDR
ncbi:hypothetical protein [Streptacidiphilus sp. ASG 303]|uniref:hypothetical protein n=1 Tax=Streptomycetaceae TaxID=2062 RepID=UPI001E3A5A77|nr:hypothetical protein [Streptacidiphilus sp. ASG 303]MCD0486113.1 hypothetical protein [Streptacidiphilus sp. ASG 303]